MDFLKNRFYNEKFYKIIAENNLKIIKYLLEEKINFSCLINNKEIETTPKINLKTDFILLEVNQSIFYNIFLNDEYFSFETYVGEDIDDLIRFKIPLINIQKISIDDIVLSLNNIVDKEEKPINNSIFRFKK